MYVCLSRNVFRARGPGIPLYLIFFCLEWLKIKPSALNLSQALLFRKVALIGVNKSNQKTHTQRKQTNKKRVMPRDGSQTTFQETRVGKNIG